MKTIWKYALDLDRGLAFDMPKDAEILDVQLQDTNPVMWAVVDPDAPLERRQFAIVGTGGPITFDAYEHVATYQDGPDVWHILEVDIVEPRNPLKRLEREIKRLKRQGGENGGSPKNPRRRVR